MKVIIPIFILLFISTAYAQDSTSNQDWVVSISTSFIGSAVGAFVLVEISIFVKRLKERQKIHDFINSDFSMINRIIETQEQSHKIMNELIQNQGQGKIYVRNYNSVINFLGQAEFRLGFLLWDAIVSSGSLIKLEGRELKTLQLSHDKILGDYKREHESWQKLADSIANVLQNESDIRILEYYFNMFTIEYFNGLFKTYNNIRYWIKLAKQNIDWLDLSKEFSTEEIKEFQSQQSPPIDTSKANIQIKDGKLVLVDIKGSYEDLEKVMMRQ
ncbi:Hypothetical protein Nlim_1812 [Candidatus Nitrosarchaeum limnium SFB1]|jgi:hypothetical protein|uniref:Uncharacterized protein n=1 Tax=Candidatus Nitrosarchaeum limnium SFB1 TaxID=886738 RepID=F3KMR1_9ARCH|nr:Hypothetical protein Nlim_1812 [Candidatus Nitrosarchaeum limnium SFB1]